MKGRTTTETEAALAVLEANARNTVDTDTARRLCHRLGVSWDAVAHQAGVFEHNGRTDWGARFEGVPGVHVPIFGLASAIADHLGAPEANVKTDYAGTGKQAEATTHHAVIRLRKHLGLEVLACPHCGEEGVVRWGVDAKAASCWEAYRDYHPDVRDRAA